MVTGGPSPLEFYAAFCAAASEEIDSLYNFWMDFYSSPP